MKQFSRSHSKAILLKAILSVGSLGLMTGGIAGGTAIATHHHTTSFTSSNKKATPKKAGTGITPNYTASDSNTVDINTIIKDNTWVGNFIGTTNPTPTDILAKASTWASSQNTPVDIDQLEITNYDDKTGTAVITATDYAVDYTPGSSTNVNFNINETEDLSVIFAGVVPTIQQERPTQAEMITWLLQNKPDLAPIWGDINIAYTSGVMTLTALKNSVNYTGEADLNVLPALMFNGASNMAFIADTVEVRASLKDLNLNGWTYTADDKSFNIDSYLKITKGQQDDNIIFTLKQAWLSDIPVTITCSYNQNGNTTPALSFTINQGTYIPTAALNIDENGCLVSINDQYDNIQNYGQLNIPSNVTSIGEMLLYNYTYTNKITSIRFQSFNNIRSFGMGCFDMAHVTGFYFGNSTTPANHLDFRDQVIGDYAFAYMAKYQQTNNIITLNFTGNCQVGNGAFYQFDSNEGSSTTCVSTIMIGNTGNTFGYGVFPTMMQGRPNLVIQLDSSCGYQKTTMGSGWAITPTSGWQGTAVGGMAGGDITLPNSTIAEYGMYGVYLNSLTATLSNVGAHALEGINLYNDRCSLTINNGATIGDNGLKFTPGMNGDNWQINVNCSSAPNLGSNCLPDNCGGPQYKGGKIHFGSSWNGQTAFDYCKSHGLGQYWTIN